MIDGSRNILLLSARRGRTSTGIRTRRTRQSNSRFRPSRRRVVCGLNSPTTHPKRPVRAVVETNSYRYYTDGRVQRSFPSSPGVPISSECCEIQSDAFAIRNYNANKRFIVYCRFFLAPIRHGVILVRVTIFPTMRENKLRSFISN